MAWWSISECILCCLLFIVAFMFICCAVASPISCKNLAFCACHLRLHHFHLLITAVPQITLTKSAIFATVYRNLCYWVILEVDEQLLSTQAKIPLSCKCLSAADMIPNSYTACFSSFVLRYLICQYLDISFGQKVHVWQLSMCIATMSDLCQLFVGFLLQWYSS